VSGAGETWGSTLGAKFYEEQLSLPEKNKTNELIDSHYHEDAALVSFQKIVRGGQALREYFREYRKLLGSLQVLSLDQFVEAEGATFLSPPYERPSVKLAL
jgi:hypothetical protein